MSTHPNYDLLCKVQDIRNLIRNQRILTDTIDRQLDDLVRQMRARDFDQGEGQ